MGGRYLWLVFGFFSTGCAIIGAVLPLIPTTPFLLLAAYAFARSSPRFHGWLVNHRQFGPLIQNWQRNGSIDPRSKRMAMAVMVFALAASWLMGASARIIIIQAVVPVFPDDTGEALAARILAQEHRIYPRAIQLYAEGRLKVVGRRVLVDGAARDEGQALIQPPLEG